MVKRIAIIGGGFSGTALAANLLRRAPKGADLEILLINRFGPIGTGVAYGTKFDGHVLNVPAEQMSAYPDEPDHFLRWGATRGVQPGDFVARKLYGEYLGETLRSAEASSAGATLEQRIDAVRSIRPEGSRATLDLQSSGAVFADRVVLALGNYSPENPRGIEGNFASSSRYVRDPWIPGSLETVEPNDTVFLIGTGLTMIDIALDLASRDLRPPITAISRRGLVPHPHVALPPRPPVAAPENLVSSGKAREYVAVLRRHAREVSSQGRDWRDAVGSVRALTPALWHALPTSEKERFLRHARPYWDIHRHRVAPSTWNTFRSLVAEGRIRVRAGRLLKMNDIGNAVSVEFRARGAADTTLLNVRRVINCTGPSSDVRSIADPLIEDLRKEGLIRADSLGLGLEVSEDLAVLDRNGLPSRMLYLVGPLLKARDWEATAVPELRRHASTLAVQLLRSLSLDLP